MDTLITINLLDKLIANIIYTLTLDLLIVTTTYNRNLKCLSND